MTSRGLSVAAVLILLPALVLPARGGSVSGASAPDQGCTPLTAAQQVAQVLGAPLRSPTADAAATGLARDHAGTVILLGDAIIDAPQVQRLTGALDAAAPAGLPPLIAVDEEGGRVARFGRSGVTTHLPSARTQAASWTVAQVTDQARALGQQMAALGVDLDLAPVLDLTAADARGVIGDRSFSADPAVAGTYGAAFASGLRQAGLRTSGKHFPDHGLTTVDTHRAVAAVDVTRQRLADHHLQPYRIALPQLDSIMLSHVRVSGLDPDLPASISASAVDFLRGELDFTGALVTDDLSMQAVAAIADQPTAALMALQAGVDLLLVGSPQAAALAHQRVLDAVGSGGIPIDRLHQAVRRVLALKGIDGTRATCLLGLPPIAQATGAVGPDGVASLITDGVRRPLPDPQTQAAYGAGTAPYSDTELAGLPVGPPVTTVRRFQTAVIAGPESDAAFVAVARTVTEHGAAAAPGVVVTSDDRAWTAVLAASLAGSRLPVLPPIPDPASMSVAVNQVVAADTPVTVLGAATVELGDRSVIRFATPDPVTAALEVHRHRQAQGLVASQDPLLVADPEQPHLEIIAPWVARQGVSVLYVDPVGPEPGEPAAVDPRVRQAAADHPGRVLTLGLPPEDTGALAGTALPPTPAGFADWMRRSGQGSGDLVVTGDVEHLLAALPTAVAAGAVAVLVDDHNRLDPDLVTAIGGWGLPAGATQTAYLAGATSDDLDRLGIPVVYGRSVQSRGS